MKCIHCGKELKYFNYVTEDDEPLCNDCYEEHYEQCSSCHRAIKRGSGMCQACSDMAFKKVINSYGTKITNRFSNKIDNIKCLNDRYFGLEMEYNHFSPAVARILFKKQYDNKLIYNKSDSSIYTGVEIVTVPMVKSRLLSLIDDMDIDKIRSKGSGKVTENAGLHIHVSRNTISKMAINKLSILFNGVWARKYKEYIYYLSGRIKDIDGNRSCCRDDYFRIGTLPIAYVNKCGETSGHNIALNLGNKNTIEFRIFKSTKNKDEMKSYIEFVELAIEFAEKQPLNMMSWNNALTYMYLNCTNKVLKDRLEKLKSKYGDKLFVVKKLVFTIDNYLDNIKGDYYEKSKVLDFMRSYTITSDIDFTSENIDIDTINTWRSMSGRRDIIGKYSKVYSMIDTMQEKIKEKFVDKILAK